MNTLYEEQKNKPYRTCFSNIYEEQSGAGFGTPWRRFWENTSMI